MSQRNKSKKLLTLLIISTFIFMSLGCLGGDDNSNENDNNQSNNVSESTKFVKENIESSEVSLKDFEKKYPDTHNYLTTYGINRIIKIKSDNIAGWEYSFATEKGSKLFTLLVKEQPKKLLGMYGSVEGNIALLGSTPVYHFTNDKTHTYLTQINNNVIVIAGDDSSLTYNESQMVVNHIREKFKNPSTDLSEDETGEKIYTSGENDDKGQTSDSDSPVSALLNQVKEMEEME